MIHVYFGGSFHPPHVGHDQMVEALLADEWADRVHVVPTGRNPLKAASGATDQRRQWVRDWIDSLRARNPSLASKLLLDETELNLVDVPSYTIDSLIRLKNRFGRDERWAIAMGADLLSQLPEWKAPRELLSQVEAVYVFARGQEKTSDVLALVPEALRSACSWRVMNRRIEDVSSTALREAMAGGLTGGLPVAPGVRL